MKTKLVRWSIILAILFSLAIFPFNSPEPTHALPVAPTLTSPANYSMPSGISIRFYWKPVAGATSYQIQVSPSSSFPTPLFHNTTLTSTSKEYNDFPDNGTVFYWRVRAKDSSGWGAWSAVWSFTNAVPRYNHDQIALTRWYGANQTATFDCCNVPQGICFDGSSIWVACETSDHVVKLRASDGAYLGDYSAGDSPLDICFCLLYTSPSPRDQA